MSVLPVAAPPMPNLPAVSARPRAAAPVPSADLGAASHDPADVGIRPVTLRFTEPWLERQFQEVVGRDSVAAYRMACLFGVGLWVLGASLLTLVGRVDPVVAAVTAIVLGLLNLGAFLAAPRATTLDRQHGIATPLAAANAVGVLALAGAAGAVEAYAASALILVEVFWFVALTRFVFAAVRSAAVLAGFGVLVALHPDPASLLVHAFLLGAGTGAILLALYRLERARRQVFQNDLIIAAQSAQLASEKERSDRLLVNVLPPAVAAQLVVEPGVLAEEAPETSVLFADLVGFTPMSARLPAAEVVHHLNEIFSRFDDLAGRRGVEKVKTIGDAYMAVAGLPVPQADHALRAVDLALAMIDETTRYAERCGLPLRLRVGVHSGPVVAGVIGKRKLSYDLWGDTVNIASRMESHGVPGAVQVSGATWGMLGDTFTGRPRGAIELKGRGRMQVWVVEGRRGNVDLPAPAVPASREAHPALREAEAGRRRRSTMPLREPAIS
jgi:class 3 adenylate cyclase